jgi:hypothetical protein
MLKIHLGALMAPWTFDVKFQYGIKFLFRSLMFTSSEDRNL